MNHCLSKQKLVEHITIHYLITQAISPRDKKKTKYVKSELRLIETLDGICDRVLQYNIHKVTETE